MRHHIPAVGSHVKPTCPAWKAACGGCMERIRVLGSLLAGGWKSFSTTYWCVRPPESSHVCRIQQASVGQGVEMDGRRPGGPDRSSVFGIGAHRLERLARTDCAFRLGKIAASSGDQRQSGSSSMVSDAACERRGTDDRQSAVGTTQEHAGTRARRCPIEIALPIARCGGAAVGKSAKAFGVPASRKIRPRELGIHAGPRRLCQILQTHEAPLDTAVRDQRRPRRGGRRHTQTQVRRHAAGERARRRRRRQAIRPRRQGRAQPETVRA